MSASDVKIHDECEVGVNVDRGQDNVEKTEEKRFLDFLPSARRFTWEGDIVLPLRRI